VLVEEGFAVYEENPGHRRSKLLRITSEGSSALRDIRRAQRRWADDVGGEIGESDLRTANAILAQMVEALSGRLPAA
jgi:DNA-binding MarR family transcriptional regulator